MKRRQVTPMLDDDTTAMIRQMFAYDVCAADYDDQPFAGYELNARLGTPPWWNPLSEVWKLFDEPAPHDYAARRWADQMGYVRDLHAKFSKKKSTRNK